MKKFQTFFIIILCSLFLFNCKKEEGSPTQISTTGTIQGKVTNATGDTVIVGATVTTTPPTSSITTKSVGDYIIPDVSPGTYSVTAMKGGYNPASVSVNVSAGKTTTANIPLNLIVNHSPNLPTIVSPADAATSQSTSLTLRWSCSDTDGDPLTYDVYLDQNNPPTTLIASNQTDTIIARTNMDTSATYYWRVVAKDNKGASTYGNVWRFTTTGGFPTQGLVAYYPFNGNANDESGNGNNGAVHGATLTSDRFGNAIKAYSFDGIDDNIEISSLSNMSYKPVTYSAWIEYADTNTSEISVRPIVGRYVATDLNIGVVAIWREPGRSLYNELVYYTGATYNRSYFTTPLNQWIHIVFTWSSQDSARWYVNGALIQSGVFTAGSSSVTPMRIASMYNAINPHQSVYFKGLLDDIRIYNRALSTAEINKLYHEGNW